MEENVKLPCNGMVYIKHTANNFQCNVINQFWLYIKMVKFSNNLIIKMLKFLSLYFNHIFSTLN